MSARLTLSHSVYDITQYILLVKSLFLTRSRSRSRTNEFDPRQSNPKFKLALMLPVDVISFVSCHRKKEVFYHPEYYIPTTLFTHTVCVRATRALQGWRFFKSGYISRIIYKAQKRRLNRPHSSTSLLTIVSVIFYLRMANNS